MWMLISAALAEPFIVLDGPRPDKDLDWLLAARLEKCLEHQSGTVVLTIQPSGEVTTVRRAHGSSSERRCLEYVISDWELPSRNDTEATRFLLRIQPPETLEGLDAHEIEHPGRLIGYVAFGDTKVQGPLERKLVPEVLRRSMKRMRFCYERIPQEPPYLNGTLTLRLNVGPDGQVDTLREVESVLVDPRVASCVEDRFMSLDFPRKGKSKRDAVVTVPVLFVPGV